MDNYIPVLVNPLSSCERMGRIPQEITSMASQGRTYTASQESMGMVSYERMQDSRGTISQDIVGTNTALPDRVLGSFHFLLCRKRSQGMHLSHQSWRRMVSQPGMYT